MIYNKIIKMEQQQKYDYAIIGGGVYGLSIAYHLAKTQATVALFERYTKIDLDSQLGMSMAARMGHQELLEVFISLNFIEI